MDKIIDPFTNIPDSNLQANNSWGINVVDNLGSISSGGGGKVFRFSQEAGFWIGAERFAAAPFSVDMAGHIKATSAEFPNLITLTVFKQTAIPTSLAIGDLWFDTDDNNKMYRAGSVGATTIATGMWELVNTVGVQIFAQDGIPTSLNAGDLWYDTNDSNKTYRATAAGDTTIAAGHWVLVNDLRAADALLKSTTGQTLSGDFGIGGSNVKIDGANARIIINDGTYDRILIGFQSGGF